MATATLNTESSTVTHYLTRGPDGELRVSFVSHTSDAHRFTVSELDALQAAIQIARRQIVENDPTRTPPTKLPVLDGPDVPDGPSLEQLFAAQQSRLAAPT